jgi:phosphoribosyl 1,2-cyclic phosphate phosphodiesterase
VKITVLGSGTSQGVPVIACDCGVCLSESQFDKRLRSSILISENELNYVIDTGPDFRQQMLINNVKSLAGVIFTHEHKDHIAGLDDVRAFNFKEKKDMEIYCSENVETALRREFYYVFNNDSYPGIPKLQLNRIKNQLFKTKSGLELLPIKVMHYKMEVFGFRIKDFTYITDAKTISEDEKEKIRGTKILILNCLHEMEHISHFNLKEALLLIDELKPKTTYLTHISHYFGKHEDIQNKLPKNVYPAYDGLTFEI